jgi:cell division protein ZapA
VTELIFEIGGRVYEVACEEGQEPSLEAAAALLDSQAQRITETASASTEKRMLLLAGLLMADEVANLRRDLAAADEKLRATEERVRIAEAKAAMLAANVLKAENAHARYEGGTDAEQLRAENDMAVGLLAKVLEDLHALATQVETGKA